MSIENGAFENERKKKEITESEKKEQLQRELEFSKEKQALLERIEKDKKMACLKSLVERWLIPISTVEHIVEWTGVDVTELKEVFDKIDEIEEVQDIDAILPQKLRITKEDYLSAVEDHTIRAAVLQKIDDALGYLYSSSHASFAGVMQFFSSLIQSLPSKKQKDIVKVQGDMIDIKRDLKKR